MVDKEMDSMCEAFHRLIESHTQVNSPFHNPVVSDAQMALRSLRAVLAAAQAKPTEPGQSTADYVRGFEAGFAHGSNAKSGPAVTIAPLLVRDLAASLGVEPLRACAALSLLGFGLHSVNMPVPLAAVGRIEQHFAAAPSPEGEAP